MGGARKSPGSAPGLADPMRGAATRTWARTAGVPGPPADGEAGRGHVEQRGLPEDPSRSASAGAGRSQKAILRPLDRLSYSPDKDGDLRTKGPSAQSSQGPRTQGWGGGCTGVRCPDKQDHHTSVPMSDARPTPGTFHVTMVGWAQFPCPAISDMGSGPRRAGRLAAILLPARDGAGWPAERRVLPKRPDWAAFPTPSPAYQANNGAQRLGGRRIADRGAVAQARRLTAGVSRYSRLASARRRQARVPAARRTHQGASSFSRPVSAAQ
jgi:hypothetical protein